MTNLVIILVSKLSAVHSSLRRHGFFNLFDTCFFGSTLSCTTTPTEQAVERTVPPPV
jgi:hypothetical protein